MDIISDRWRWFRRGKRKAMAVAAAVGVITGVAAMGMLSIPAGAAGAQDIFELEGNTADDASSAPRDWSSFFNADGTSKARPANFVDSGFDADHEFPDRSTFTGGSKDTLDVSGWSCTDSNNLGGKFDIINAYSTIYEVPADGGGYTKGDKLLFFGIERAATEGDGNMGFWFLKDGNVGCEKNAGGKAPAFGGNHVEGDIFVVAGFSNGGTDASVTAYKWNGGAGGSLSSQPFVTATQACTSQTASAEACGVVNGATIATNAGKPWSSPDKSGGDLDVNAFYEGFVRVPAGTSSGCFSTFVANTRSSTSPTATIMDFSRGSFPTCQPSTILTSVPSVAAPTVATTGSSVGLSFTERNDGNSPLTGVKVTTDSSACNATMAPSGTVSLAAGAQQVFTCTVTAPATATILDVVATGEGISAVGNVTWCSNTAAPPTGVKCDQEERTTARVVAIAPSTALTVSANPTTVRSGTSVTLTIAETNNGTAPGGYTSALDLTGVGVSVTGVAGCTPTLASPSGDTNVDTKLNAGETWTYTCTFPAPPNSFTAVATGNGTVLTGTAQAKAVTFCLPTCTGGQIHDADERDDVDVTLINPTTELTVTATARITYTFSEYNDSPNAPLTPPTATDRTSVISVGTGMCNVSAPEYVSGDQADGQAGAKILQPTERWVFTCVGSLAGPTGDTGTESKLLTGIGRGLDGTGVDVTFPADVHERDAVTVTITNGARG